jgi:hypothetical protein
MKHQQILDKLAAKSMVEAIELDLGLIIREQWNQGINVDKLLDTLLQRWNCALLAPETEVSSLYKDKVVLAICVLLHKYGIQKDEITDKAIQAIDSLNKAVALSDAFYHQSSKIKEYLKTSSLPLKKRPSFKDAITFYRAQDVISICLDNKYYVAYVHDTNGNKSPIIEFYDMVFDQRPTDIKQLMNINARGTLYNDGSRRISKYSIYGLKDLPDWANQVHLIKASIETPPSTLDLKESVALYAVSRIIDLPSIIKGLFVNS